MFIPNTTAQLYRRIAKNIYGQGSYADPKTVPCAVVDFKPKVMKTSVRADQSGTRGAAEEIVTVAKLLFPMSVTLADGDRVDIDGQKMRVIAIFPRRDVTGVLDHQEVDFGAWAAA